MEIDFRPIGRIISPFRDIEGMPIQPTGASGVQGRIEVFPEFSEGLKDLDGFSHIILLYWFHRVKEAKLTVVPFLDTKPRGIFSTRAPKRPNPIGLSIVRLIDIKGNTVFIENVDILNETPLLDIKPYIPEFDRPPADKTGWYDKAKGEVRTKRSDDRFR
ncbi:MAG: tRNA (N6-threonylcarbamoyladenosine(37)-N6)-methyltransferase TrmO [Proteobacteria bacterium]|nr:tRNA (N6-threonylcarbamoyladenosine(37)-N6)-methyltransferase TrmO [Pseudomonadota bacterium]